jgi:dipeptidase D
VAICFSSERRILRVILSGMNSLDTLHPRAVWSHFSALCAIPRPSLHEAPLRDHLVTWAEVRGIGTEVDAVGNLILRKSASPGCESMPGVVLQGHIDMVCQANSGAVHDFEHDPILARVIDGWVVAENTTLGADNGIGVALALAALEDTELLHPALEVLLTVNEESGMDGARGLAPGALRGRALINLDTEEWGCFYLGCAGGVDVEVRRTCPLETVPEEYVLWQLGVTGLKGGHSGIDIHIGRGNAIKLLTEALCALNKLHDLRLISLDGGSARNAIPREAFAVLALPPSVGLEVWATEFGDELRRRFADADPELRLGCKLAATSLRQAVVREEQERLIGYLSTSPNGVAAMSRDFVGVVDSSDNLGVAMLKDGQFRATSKVRSLDDRRADGLADELLRHATDRGLEAEKSGAYPGWTPNPASNLLALCQQTYADQFGQAASLQVIHAGLECGLLAASHPQLDMISFGPDIRGAHAPGERVEIESVARCWQLLRAVLRTLAGR